MNPLASGALFALVVEDRPEDFDLVAHELRRAGFDYMAQLRARPDIILSDYSVPGFDALRALRLMQEQGMDIPFIVLSGAVDEETLVECMKRGAPTTCSRTGWSDWTRQWRAPYRNANCAARSGKQRRR